ncbi:MarR family winged helix-turn-helix transcriptional regulator [Paenibacillus sp. 32352]|uniref:MarR family winged helix-turn-helix transcriptional regulator n=1 Tax=Paenibacillus sp. 32352 TaxID=1969111 RepID=UPI0009AD80AE|nr:MarR family transcriptional regulator [Paenibacillus sp. 32352]
MTKSRNELRKLALGTLKLVKEFQHAQDRRSDLDRVTFEILMLVKIREQMRLTDIAKELQMNPSSITRRIQSLKQLNQISVISDPNDLRSSLICLTEIGEEMLKEFFERSVDGLAHILMEWNDDEIRVLADSLTRYADAMETWRTSTANTQEGVNDHGE